jgi:AcrR family transcriptional regulator
MINSEKPNETQRKILNTARLLFVKKGYKGTTVRNIANAAGTNVAMVNYYFRSKENLFDAIFEEAFRTIASKVFAAVDSDLPLFELIEHWVNSYFDLLIENPHFPLFVLNEMAQNPEKLGKRFRLGSPYQLYSKLAIRIYAEEQKGTIDINSYSDLFLNIISLSIFPFICRPVVMQLLNMTEIQYNEMLDNHRKYAVDFIIKAIKKEG